MYQGRFSARMRIARRLVRGHRRAPADVLGHHVVEQLRQLRVVEVRLDVQLAGAAEAVDFVREIHVRREILDPVERGVGDAVEVLDAVHAVVDEVARRRLAHRDVDGRRQPDLLGLVDRGGHLILVHRADQLDAVGAPLLRAAHQGAPFVGRHRRGFTRVEQVDEHRVVHDARRDDRVRGALGLPLLRLREVAAHLPRRRHAGRQVEIALVLDRDRPRTLRVPVHVRVDDPRHDVFAGRVDDLVGLGPGAGASRHRRARHRGRPDPADEAVLDQDVDRAVRGDRGALDDHRAADQQALDLFGVDRRLGRRRRLRGRRPRPEREHRARHRRAQEVSFHECPQGG